MPQHIDHVLRKRLFDLGEKCGFTFRNDTDLWLRLALIQRELADRVVTIRTLQEELSGIVRGLHLSQEGSGATKH